jgi:hypothetical protein
MGTTGIPKTNSSVVLPESFAEKVIRVTDHLDQIYVDEEALREAREIHRRIQGLSLWEIFRKLGG